MNTKNPMIPAGSRFLPDTGRTYLLKCHKSEKDPKIRDRLMAYVLRKDGTSIHGIARSINRPYTTVRDWLVRAVQLGVTGRYDVMQEGRPCRLTTEQLAQLRGELIAGPRACGFESGMWTCRIVVEHVRRRYGTQYKDRGMWDLLDRLGFLSSRKPRPRHPKSASKKAMGTFKKKQGAVPDITHQKNTR